MQDAQKPITVVTVQTHSGMSLSCNLKYLRCLRGGKLGLSEGGLKHTHAIFHPASPRQSAVGLEATSPFSLTPVSHQQGSCQSSVQT